jgi:hypothetical protein
LVQKNQLQLVRIDCWCPEDSRLCDGLPEPLLDDVGDLCVFRLPEADGRGPADGQVAKRDVAGAMVLQIEPELERAIHKFVLVAGRRKIQLRQRCLQVGDVALVQLVPDEALAPQKRKWCR